jgi:hypothetical protein
MTNLLPKFVLAEIIYCGWCAFVHFLAAATIPAALGNPDPTSAFPFANAHLLEEALQGHYRPLSSVPFLVYVLVLSLVGFLVGVFIVSALLRLHHSYFRALLAVVPVAALALMLGFVFRPAYPEVVRTAAVVALVLFLCSGILGSKLYSLRSSHAT